MLFDKTARVLSDLGAGHLDATWERRLRRYLAPDLLILDDFGLRAFSERQGEDLYELISERVRRGSTIVTSNWPPKEWYALSPTRSARGHVKVPTRGQEKSPPPSAR